MSVESKGQANFKCGFCGKVYKIQAIADDADINLFGKMANHRHCVHTLFHPIKSCKYYLRPKEHMNCPDVTVRCIKSHLYGTTFSL